MSLQFFSLETGLTYVFAVHSKRYPLVGGRGYRCFAGTNLKPRKLSENVHTSKTVSCTSKSPFSGAVLGVFHVLDSFGNGYLSHAIFQATSADFP